ncbi:MAG: hypothetical protein WA771_04655, partial [Chthoniobacterales bacterium]
NTQRLRYYFNGFLHLKLCNLRSVYRLIDALEFSTGALTRGQQLEVDLIDLCAIDYLQLNMPALAEWIHEQGPEFFSSRGMFGRWHSDEELPKFSTLVPDGLKSDPGVAACYSVLRQLFPSMASVVDLDRAFARSITQFVQKDTYPLAIRDEEHFDAYFVFQPSPTKIPENLFQTAWNNLIDGRPEMIDCAHWSSKRWLISAMRRFDTELPNLTNSQKQDLFLAFARDADAYGHHDSAQSLFKELTWAIHFMEHLIADQPETEKASLLERLYIDDSSLFTRMLFLENMWIRCAPDEWQGRHAKSGTPLVERQRVAELQMVLAPIAASAISHGSYLDHPAVGSRLYRWVNSVGITHTGPAMREFLARGRNELILQVMRGIARSISPQYSTTFEVCTSYANTEEKGVSESFFAELLKFSERDFWELFEQSQSSTFPTVLIPGNGDDCLIHHLRRAVRSDESLPLS